jgi:hypothetical protein
VKGRIDPNAANRIIADSRFFSVGMHVKTTTVSGYLMMRSLAWLKRFRRGTYRYHEEHQLIERWLCAIYTTGAEISTSHWKSPNVSG